MRQIEKVDEKSRRDRRHDHVGQHLRQAAQCRRENPELPTVAHFQKLAEAHRLGFPEAVGAIAGQPHDDAQRQCQILPESECEAGFVVHLNEGDQPDDRQCVGDVRHADHVAAANPPRR
ncbi:hypothetical protein SDC9_101900 [bioreactor metagenome]|uniref:Uncharacterized protein n=1 Tax=bioreactor metagenome TaxID=1076179 RepID=A0A645APD7_9ZZZZ